MKHLIIISAISVLSLISIGANSIKLITEKPTVTEREYEIKEETAYTLKGYNGQLALFTNHGNKPCKIFDIFISSLPQEDKTRLETGITVYTEEEIQKLIEEYTS